MSLRWRCSGVGRMSGTSSFVHKYSNCSGVKRVSCTNRRPSSSTFAAASVCGRFARRSHESSSSSSLVSSTSAATSAATCAARRPKLMPPSELSEPLSDVVSKLSLLETQLSVVLLSSLLIGTDFER